MNRLLRRQQLDRQVSTLVGLHRDPPNRGWIAAVRQAIGMSSRQLGDRLGVSQQSAAELEQAERTGAITLKNLRRVARAMNTDLFYAFVPRTSFEQVVTDQATLQAANVVNRVETSMSLEQQGTAPEAQRQRQADLANEYVRSTPRDLWDRN